MIVDHLDATVTECHDDIEFNLQCFLLSLKSSEPPSLWHMRRLGHPSNKLLTTFLRFHTLFFKHVHDECMACAFGKRKKQTHLSIESVYFVHFDLILVDVWGPSSYTSINNNYDLSVVDAYS